MLEYDEWVVPGEVEYAEKKAAEIESQIERYHKVSLRGDWERCDWIFYVQITEHVVGKFAVTIPKPVWELAIRDIDISNSMILDWFQDAVAPIDEPKIFNLPDDDIRSSLPEWDESFIPEDIQNQILHWHSKRYIAISVIEEERYSIDTYKKFGTTDAKREKAWHEFIYKLQSEKYEIFNKAEEEAAEYWKSNGNYYYEPWCFSLSMTKTDIINVIHEAYLNAGKRSKGIFPNRIDCENLGRPFEVNHHPIKNYERLYQGRSGDIIIRFLFDFKDMKIVMAYPVLKEIHMTGREYHYYWKEGKYFTWGYFYMEK